MSDRRQRMAERVREPVMWFAQQMEAKLRENDHKGGWQDCSLDWLVGRLYREAKELWIEVDRVVPEPERIIREAADVANFAMMIADIARRINAKEKVGTDEWRHKYFGAEWPEVEGDENDA